MPERFSAATGWLLPALFTALALTGCSRMPGTITDDSGYTALHTCVLRVSDIDKQLAEIGDGTNGDGFTAAQLRAYYAQFPIARAWRSNEDCYAQYWCIPSAISVATNAGEDELTLRFPMPEPGQPVPPDGVEGLGTADVTVSHTRRPPEVVGRGTILNDDGSLRVDPERDVAHHDPLGFYLVVQKACPDVGGRLVHGISKRRPGLTFVSELDCGKTISVLDLNGARLHNLTDFGISISFNVWPPNQIRIHEISNGLALKIEQLKTSPVRVNPVWTMEK